MSSVPTCVLVDDGELERVRVILEASGSSFELVRGDRSSPPPAAAALLVSTARRASSLPRLPAQRSAPIWVCVGLSESPSVRARLRERGVSYLVDAALDQESLRLLIAHCLYRGEDRRTAPRLPMGVEVAFELDLPDAGEWTKAKLVDLSLVGARLRVPTPLAIGTPVRLVLPRELRGNALDELLGRVVRGDPPAAPRAGRGFVAAIAFEELSAEAEVELSRLLDGHLAGIRVAPLQSKPEKPRERRRSSRRAYAERVPLLASPDAGAPEIVLGRDVSLEGMRLAPRPGLKPGERVAVALHGALEGRSLVLEADVARIDPDGCVALTFRRLDAARRAAIAELVARLPLLDDLDSTLRGGGGRVLTEILAEDPDATRAIIQSD